MWNTFRTLSLDFGSPWWLLLIPALIPALIWFSFRSLSGLGRARRALAILLRTTVVVLIVLALAEVRTVRRTDRLTTIFVVDVSQSVPREWQKAALEFVNRE